MEDRYDQAARRINEAEKKYEEVRGKAETSENLAKKIEELTREIKEIEEEYSGLGEQRKALDQFAKEEELKIREIARKGEMVQEQRDRMEKEMAEMEEKKNRLQKYVEEFDPKKEQFIEWKKSAQEEKKILEDEINKFAKEIAEKSKELASIESELERKKEVAESAEKRANEAEDRARSAEVRKESYEREVEKMKGEMGGKLGENKQGKTRLGNLTRQPGCVGGYRSDKPIQDENEALDEAISLIRQWGLKFNQRMVWRLHTSLKIAEVSPLTVLAGISGTGKTQLPRAYAEAMGMYLLVVPVQPRWDSPIDLVGSYDYMHGRYQATELARLLWNFDQGRKNEQEDGRMAMVLLDEMNLARTEYYFSDFLSRLELRQAREEFKEGGPRPETMIELDVPHGEGEEAERIYPSERILWVGTMNEDESTQTLSDKVIDRSNVIRFPRPQEIQFTAMGTGLDKNGREGGEKALKDENWRRWCEGREMESEARQTITLINEEVMERVGRPFGHRMGQAMARYIERYPSKDWRNALVDQVEMRVLPKLTGIDGANQGAADALDRLSKICDQNLDDQDLANAVSNATNTMHSVGTFAWTGRQIG